MSVLYIRDKHGNLIPVQTIQGEKGADGYTPVRGIDYWTEADREAVIQEVIIALGTPVFGTVDTENNIILTGNLADGAYTLKYEDAEGNQTEIGTVQIGAGITNMLPLAINADGSEYVGPAGEDGYKAGYRLNSSGIEAELSGKYVTGFIPVKSGDIVRLKNISWTTSSSDASSSYFTLYDASFTFINNGYKRADDDFSTAITAGAISFDSNNNLVEITLSKDIFKYIEDFSAIAYMRLSADSISSESIITVNQEIV